MPSQSPVASRQSPVASRRSLARRVPLRFARLGLERLEDVIAPNFLGAAPVPFDALDAPAPWSEVSIVQHPELLAYAPQVARPPGAWSGAEPDPDSAADEVFTQAAEEARRDEPSAPCDRAFVEDETRAFDEMPGYWDFGGPFVPDEPEAARGAVTPDDADELPLSASFASTSDESPESVNAPAASAPAESQVAALWPLLNVSFGSGGLTAAETGAGAATPSVPANGGSQADAAPAVPAIDKDELLRTLRSQGMRFEANAGQFAAGYDFVARADGYEVALGATGATLALAGEAGTSFVTMTLAGGNAGARAVGRERMSGTTNYFAQGSSQANVASYGQVVYEGVYAGIDAVYRTAEGGGLEYDFLVAPGAEVGTIGLTFGGAQGVWIDAEGELVLETPAGQVRQHAPVTYQVIGGERVAVESRFAMGEGGRVGFEVGAYDRGRALVVDPQWGYSSYLGGTGDDLAAAVALRETNDGVFAYVVGQTKSSQFRPNDPNPKSPTKLFPANANVFNGDVFVAKLNAAGTDLSYLTYLVGQGNDDFAQAVAVAGNGDAFVVGYTNSNDFPTANAWRNASLGGYDAFAAKLSNDGTTLRYSTYLGGDGNDRAYSVYQDSNGNAFIGGGTASELWEGTNARPSDDAWLPGVNDMQENGFLAVLTAAGALDYWAAFGGSGNERVYAIGSYDGTNILLTGATASTDLATTANAYQKQATDGVNAFVAKITPANLANQRLGFLSYFGSKGDDTAFSLAVEESNFYVGGGTTSAKTEVWGKPGNGQAGINPILFNSEATGGSDGWVARFANDDERARLLFYVAGKKRDVVSALALSGSSLFIAGGTQSDPRELAKGDYFPAQAGNLQAHNRGANVGRYDAFVMRMKPDDVDVNAQDASASLRDSVVYSTYIGGSGHEAARGIAVDSTNNAYVAGTTYSVNFRPPSLAGPAPKQPVPGFQEAAGFARTDNGSDGFVVKILPVAPQNRAPKQGGMSALTVPVGNAATFQVSAIDPDFDALEYRLVGAPVGASLDVNTGAFSWTPTSAQAQKAYTFTVVVDDPSGASDEQAVTVTVAATSNDPAGDTIPTALPVLALVNYMSEVNGSVGSGAHGANDVRFYRVELFAGQTLLADIDAQATDDGGAPLSDFDGMLRLFDANGQELASNQSGQDPDTELTGPDPVLSYLVPTDGPYFIGVSFDSNAAYDPFVANSGDGGPPGPAPLPGSPAPPLGGAYRIQLTTISDGNNDPFA